MVFSEIFSQVDSKGSLFSSAIILNPKLLTLSSNRFCIYSLIETVKVESVVKFEILYGKPYDSYGSSR